MDQYRTWLSGLKSSLTSTDNETLNSTINIARGTRDGIPQELRRSTFVGQPQVLETLTDLQNALVAGDEITSMKASIFSRIEEWESTTNHPSIPSPSPGRFSLAPSPSPVSQYSQSESSYDSAEFRTFAPRRQESIANRRRIGTPSISGGQPHPVDIENLLGGGARFLPPRVPRSTSAAGLAAKPPNTNRKEDDYLRQILVSQQNLTARYQELETLVKKYAYSSQKNEDLWNQRLLQESQWKDVIHEKLQFILDILQPVFGHPPSGPPTYPPPSGPPTYPPPSGPPTYPPANFAANLEPPITHFTPNLPQFAQHFTQLTPSFQAGQAGQPSIQTGQAGQAPTYGQSPLTGQAPMQISTTEGSYSGADGRMIFSTRRAS